MSGAPIRKHDRVEVAHQSGTEYGTVEAVIRFEAGGVRVHVLMDDGTRCSFPRDQVKSERER